MYNEEVNDLLAPENKKLAVHESREQGVYVAGLREDIVTSATQVLHRTDNGHGWTLFLCFTVHFIHIRHFHLASWAGCLWTGPLPYCAACCTEGRLLLREYMFEHAKSANPV